MRLTANALHSAAIVALLAVAAVVSAADADPAADDAGRRVIVFKSLVGMMQYETKAFTAKPGEKLKIEFQNPDVMQHNLVILKPGTLDQFSPLVDAMAADPQGMLKSFIPDAPEAVAAIVAKCRLVNPNETVIVRVDVPAEAGEYPYLCTFPGHRLLMKGVMTVAP